MLESISAAQVVSITKPSNSSSPIRHEQEFKWTYKALARPIDMSTISASIFPATHFLCSTNNSSSSRFSLFSFSCPSSLSRYPSCIYHLCHSRRKTLTVVSSKSSEAEEELSSTEDEWLKKLPDKKKPLYSHSLPCIETWLRNLGFYRSKDDRAVWFIEKPEWHAQLSLDITDLFIR